MFKYGFQLSFGARAMGTEEKMKHNLELITSLKK